MSDVPLPKNPEKAVAKAVAALADLKRVAESRAKRNQHLDMIDALFNSAQAGNSEDFKILVHLANNASLKVLELSQTNFESARQIARRFRSWPSLLYQSKRINEIEFIVDRCSRGSWWWGDQVFSGAGGDPQVVQPTG